MCVARRKSIGRLVYGAVREYGLIEIYGVCIAGDRLIPERCHWFGRSSDNRYPIKQTELQATLVDENYF